VKPRRMARHDRWHGSLEGWYRPAAAGTLASRDACEDKPMNTLTDVDLLVSLHKALRCFIFEVLVDVGRVDVSDGEAVHRTAQQVQRLLALRREPRGPLHLAVAQLQCGPLAQRAAAARELYQALSQWSIATLQQLALDELRQAGQPTLPSAQAAAQRRRQLASLSTDELRDALHWMGRALTPQELAPLVADLRQLDEGARLSLALAA
jgi:hypothetical protein